MTPRLLAAIGAINALLAVAAGAFGAHGLKKKLTADMLAVFETGARYHMFHALGLFGAAWLVDRLGPGKGGLAATGGTLLLAGIVIFSGSLYALALSGVKVLGAITPIGGLAFLIGWALLAIAALRL